MILTGILSFILIYYIWKTDKLDDKLNKAKKYCYECGKLLKKR
jgi:uncharacterized membrane protein